MNNLPRNSLLSLGGLLFPIIVHGIHMLLPLLATSGATLTSSIHKHQNGGQSLQDPFMDGLILGITVISTLFTIWYLYRIWTRKDCSRTAAWSYTAISVFCFGLILFLM
ncbi:hypothetical protein [Paenibacillus radicis (ex Gao et al. 2016)]|uniref:Uncharacterized protein n=1 Tax=Paenibacillus radicis (ex Gao et al. 2016) TaxID=1737354 RepID=A0A917H1F1_9BACL|nr:hypothetical protein [Paenibacillus radicis (ex Gao et al. 2016)]GGG63759.1 hypothetical protein GCM10010918_17190 [Paenibacillus radicis (ex Gao et al. 2016)]